MNETGYDLVAHKHYRHRVINIVRMDSKLTGYKYFAKRDRKLKGIVIFRRNSDYFRWMQNYFHILFTYQSRLPNALRVFKFIIYHCSIGNTFLSNSSCGLVNKIEHGPMRVRTIV